MTPMQLRLLDWISAFIMEKRYSPSFDEMRVGVGLASKSGVYRMLCGLRDAGHIRMRRNHARSVEIIGLQVPPPPGQHNWIDQIAKELVENHADRLDDDGPPIIMVTEDELRQVLERFL